MGWLGRLVGREPPRIPAGGHAFTSLEPNGQWSVRVAMPGDDCRCCAKRIGPAFDTLPDADGYLAWVTGAAPSFTYPPGSA